MSANALHFEQQTWWWPRWGCFCCPLTCNTTLSPTGTAPLARLPRLPCLPRSSHVRPAFRQPALQPACHFGLCIRHTTTTYPYLPSHPSLPSHLSHRRPPGTDGTGVSPTAYHSRFNTPRAVPRPLGPAACAQTLGARPSTEATDSNQKTRQRRYEPSPPSKHLLRCPEAHPDPCSLLF